MYLHANIEMKGNGSRKNEAIPEASYTGIVRTTNGWPSCNPSNYVELKNEKGAILSMNLKNRLVSSALSGASKNIHYTELGIKAIFTPERHDNIYFTRTILTETFSKSFSRTFSKGVCNEFMRKGQE